MSNFPPLESDRNESDVPVDALLNEVAANENGDDETFLESMEAAIDEADVIPLPAASSGKFRPLLFSIAIAACAAAGLFYSLTLTLWEDPPIPFTVGMSSNTRDFIGCGPGLKRLEVKPDREAIPLATITPKIDPAVTQPLDTTGSLASISYVRRLQEQVKLADGGALRGSKLMADGDYQGAIDQYRNALALLPDAPMTKPRRFAYTKQFARASVLFGRNRADEGRYPEAIAAVEEVLQPSVDPDSIDAKRLLDQLNDTDYYSPTLTPSHLQRVRRVKLALKTGQGYIDLGDYDRADREYHKALSDDPYNVAARRGQENIERHRMHYYEAAYDHTRPKMLRQVAAGWESPTPSDNAPVADATGKTNSIISSTAFSNFSVPSLSEPSAPASRSEISWTGLSASNGLRSDSIVSQHLRSSPMTGAGSIEEIARWGTEPTSEAPSSKLAISIPIAESISKSQYPALVDNSWASPLTDPLSTFSTDVDTASWTNLRAMIRDGSALRFIPKDAVRIEEMINYFDWNYPKPKGEDPFSIQLEAAPCPWNDKHQLLRIGLQGKEIPRIDRPPANLIFLIDVSGSMNEPNKLPLLKEAIAILVEELSSEDKVAIVVYAGSEGVSLPPTSGRDRETILGALENLKSGGSTNGGAGIKLAYRLAKEQFIKKGINRVILCTDEDFNVGLTGTKEPVKLVENEAKAGTYLSVLGFGQGNLNDAMLEEVTNRGNGNYFHINGLKEARKVLLSDLMGTLVTIAKDVKIQVEFNPAHVAKYRLIGYANRKLAPEDFANDKIDAGGIGSGHTVTALYEIVPGKAQPAPPELRYQSDGTPTETKELIPSEELALIKLRYKKPQEDISILMTETILPPNMVDSLTSRDYPFAAAVALFGMILRNHEDVKDATLQEVIALAEPSIGPDHLGYRAEFLELVKELSQN